MAALNRYQHEEAAGEEEKTRSLGFLLLFLSVLLFVGYFSTGRRVPYLVSGAHAARVHVHLERSADADGWVASPTITVEAKTQLCFCLSREKKEKKRKGRKKPPLLMDNRRSNQLELRKPAGIKTWLDSHRAVTTVPGAWLQENQNAVIMHSRNHLLAVLWDRRALRTRGSETLSAWKRQRSDTWSPTGWLRLALTVTVGSVAQSHEEFETGSKCKYTKEYFAHKKKNPVELVSSSRLSPLN